ncbi:MAG TPA: hypothetical protein PLO84_12405 [Thermotogota bacterium]|nr:hypothetical protein [Thermotogota bacterium]
MKREKNNDDIDPVFCGAIGFVGKNSSTIDRCYSTVEVDSLGNSGGFCSNFIDGATITNSFWETTGNIADSNGGTGLPVTEMKDKSTYTNATWNFGGSDPVWIIDSGKNNGYPYLSKNDPF